MAKETVGNKMYVTLENNVIFCKVHSEKAWVEVTTIEEAKKLAKNNGFDGIYQDFIDCRNPELAAKMEAKRVYLRDLFSIWSAMDQGQQVEKMEEVIDCYTLLEGWEKHSLLIDGDAPYRLFKWDGPPGIERRFVLDGTTKIAFKEYYGASCTNYSRDISSLIDDQRYYAYPPFGKISGVNISEVEKRIFTSEINGRYSRVVWEGDNSLTGAYGGEVNLTMPICWIPVSAFYKKDSNDSYPGKIMYGTHDSHIDKFQVIETLFGVFENRKSYCLQNGTVDL